MKLAQGDRGEVQGGKWSGDARAEAVQRDEHESEPEGMLAAGHRPHESHGSDDPYRGMSDGEMLEF